MSPERSANADALFDRLVTRFRDEPDVTPPSPGGKFGASGLKVGGKLFAMVSKEKLVVKLPQGRVGELIDAGTGEPFDAGKGKPMKEWVALDPSHGGLWTGLAEEALAFARGRS